MADHTQDNLFREIDEDLRQERYTKLWKKYGSYVIAAAVALIVGVAGFKGWEAWDIKTRRAEGEQFNNALQLVADKQTAAAREAFAQIAVESGAGYAMMARFNEAALLADGGDRASATAAYRELAADTGIDPLYRDLATLLGVLHQMTGADPGDLRQRLAPLTADDNPWRFTAKELTAVLALRSGDREKAREIFTILAGDALAPQGLRTRAGEFVAIIGE